MLTPISLMDDICNKKTLSLSEGNDFADLDMGKYMFCRWMSMTNPKNALIASELFNAFGTPDDKEYLYKVASTFACGYRKFRYLKKPKEKKPVEKKREWGDELSERERRMYAETLDFLEDSK